MKNEPWTTEENITIIAIYLGMLVLQNKGEKYCKSTFRREVENKTGRSKASVEFKFCNISAVLRDLDSDYLQGYKPLPHYQKELKFLIQQTIDNSN